MRSRVILAFLGAVITTVGALLLLPVIVGKLYGESFVLLEGFLYGAFLALFAGNVMTVLGRFKRPSVVEGMLICVLGWAFVSLFGAIPYFIHGLGAVDAYFEAMSGFTTTGITMIQGLSLLPHSLLFWRSLTQWIGGLGILTFFIVITVEVGGVAFKLFSAESTKVSTKRTTPGLFNTIRTLWQIYILLTLLETAILKIMGLSFFNAFIHSLTTISTGGFSSFDASVAAFTPGVQSVIILFMFLSGTNFVLLYALFLGDIFSLFKNFEFKLYTSLLLIATTFVTFDFMSKLALPFLLAFRQALFQVVAVGTTTGFATMEFTQIPAFSKLILLFLMFAGGCAGSTGGGFKMLRIGMLFKTGSRLIKRIYFPPAAVTPVVIGGHAIDEKEVDKVSGLFVLYAAVLFIGGLFVVLMAGPAFSVLSGMFSALGNIGPFYMSVGEVIALPVSVKLTYILGMLAGRLELLPLLVLLDPRVWRGLPD